LHRNTSAVKAGILLRDQEDVSRNKLACHYVRLIGLKGNNACFGAERVRYACMPASEFVACTVTDDELRYC